MEVRQLPLFRDIGWRWLAYAASAIVITMVILASSLKVEFRRDVACEVVSPSMHRIHGEGGWVSDIYVDAGQSVKKGEKLLALRSKFSDSADTSDRATTMLAPKDGVVLFVNARKGQFLQQNDTAIVVEEASREPLFVVMRIPSEQRGFIRSGQQLRIKLDAFPYGRFGTRSATVDSISLTTIGSAAATRMFDDSGIFSGADGDYVAWAKLGERSFRYGGEELGILPGMRGKASVVVGRMTIAEWLFAPLLNVERS
ncbi:MULTISPECIES: efflux RND transporter periplasmic adaptor subunit [unclassified Dyella]|uniref:efflux RND transporter periplasmic adaptor subunit n=1 Tax=unclassified Dyella TaxID=2634549 RepID=UPI000C828F57|nr:MULTISPECIES: efflux RND transporter periplasmic adaptor subunit [unclassified Dyella]MDR3444788.1 efflux RND transporter periplasmic adaptor subunit [Dyella sp.]PMQ06841.1 Colicin V secretion protein CvaA [Dyella sp. AD56]